MKLIINDSSGVQKAIVSPSDNSSHTKEVMRDSILHVSFVLPEYLELDVNDYIEFNGERFTLLEKYRPVMKSTVEYQYDCKFYGIESELKNAVVLKMVDGEMDPKFALTDQAAAHLQVIIDNINRIKETNVWTIGEVVSSETVVVEYDNTCCFDALTKIAEACGTEWWVEGTTINLSRCEHGTSIELGYKQGLTNLSRSDNENARFFTRLIPVGAIRNIYKDDYGHHRLQLPEGLKWIEQNLEYGIKEYVEEAYFSKIYPRRVGTVGTARTEERTGEDDEPFTVYFFTDPGMPFDPNDYMMPGLVINIVFQSGELNGRDFEVNYDSDTGEFEIINKYEYDNQIPGGYLIPKSGDKYILYNLRMPSEYYELAEQEFYEAALAFIEEYSQDVSIYRSNSDYIYFQKNNVILRLGQRVKLISDVYFPEGNRQSRITSFARNLNNPWQYEIGCSYAVSKGRLDVIESRIDNVRATFREQLNANIFSILKTYDSIDPSDYNVFSSLRTLQAISDAIRRLEGSVFEKYLRKDVQDEAEELITFRRGLISLDTIRSGLFQQGYYEGFGWSIESDGKAWFREINLRGDLWGFGRIGTPVFASGFTGWGTELDLDRASLELDYLTVRKSMRVYELVVNQLRGSNGNLVVSDFNKLKEVEDRGDVWRCVIDDYDGEMYMNMREGDIVRCQVFDGNNIKYYIGTVTAVGNDWFEIDKEMLDGADVPQPGDVLCRWNSFTDTDRQGLIYLTSSDSHSPYIDILDGGPELNEFERLRARIGRLSGIHDPAFPNMRKYGIYTDSFYGKGELILHSSGQSITTMFAVIDGRITAEVSEIKSLMPAIENILKNSTFNTDTAYWNYSNEGVKAYIADTLLFVGNSLFMSKENATEIIFDETTARRVLKLIDNTVIQSEPNYNKVEVAEDVKFELNFTYKIIKPGLFSIGIPDTELYLSEEKTEGAWETKVIVGVWDQTGDFEISIEGGEVLIYNVSLKISDRSYLIDLIEELRAGLQITAEEAKLYADAKYLDLYGRVTNEYTSAISVSAQNINLSITGIQNELSTFKSETNTSISLLNGQIALKVNQTAFDALGNRVSTAESTIIQLANQIALKVNQTDFDTLFGRVSVAESNITLLSNQINVKVSQTDFDAYKNFVSQTYATTVWTSSQIANYVLKADYNGATVASLINQSPDSVKIFANKVDIRAGEYNSVRDSEFLITTSMLLAAGVSVVGNAATNNPFGITKNIRMWNIGAIYSTSGYHIRFNNVINKNGTYTFSAYILTSKPGRVVMDVADNEGAPFDLQAGVWKRCYITVDVSNYTSVAYHFADFLFQEQSGGNLINASYMDVYITMVKVEEGNFLTNWTLHPDEIAANVQSAINQAIISMQSGLGALAWQNSVQSAMQAETLIVGGYLKNSLIDTGWIRTQILQANYIEALVVNFRQGTIGGFEIANERIGVAASGSETGSIHGMSLYSDFIKFSTTNVWVGIGTNVLPATLGGLRGLARFENKENNPYYTNYGIFIDVANGQKNEAITIQNGYISGLAYKTTIVGDGQAPHFFAASSDVFIIGWNNTTETTVVLPDNPNEGKIIIIKATGAARLNVRANDNTRPIYTNTNIAWSTYYEIGRGNSVMLIYSKLINVSGTTGMWHLNKLGY